MTETRWAWPCDRPMRNGRCQMDPDHKGRHSTVVFECDYCGKVRRGTPIDYGFTASDGYYESVAGVCFLCDRGLSRWQKDADDEQARYRSGQPR